MPLAVSIDSDSVELRMQVVGELDLATAPSLERCFGDLRTDGTSLCLDLTRVSFLDLSGLRVLLDAQRNAHAHDKQLRVVAGEAVRRLCELTETTRLLDLR